MLGVTALGDTHEEARAKAYDNIARIDLRRHAVQERHRNHKQEIDRRKSG